ncbi:hypothetical protein KRR39_10485 [Nocardioides panacis]|uniref:DUF4386 family protein n=1 Tax=Nocardioides panacis TaxID=2849501 RepID=A0A975Y224_9ACTN|nr:hypothetical protein [Nocardioides panacis]QWZ10116.1 hypothetical protein KRR39_10485 [Nocardioides panacis]
MVDAAWLRVGATAGVAGLLVQVVMGQMHPAHADPNDSRAAFIEYASYAHWTLVHIGQWVGTLLLGLALIMLALSLVRQPGLPGALAFVGAVTSVLLVAVFTVQMAVDGVALRSAIDTWTSAPVGAGKTSAFQVAEGVRGVEKGLSGFFHLTNGLTLVSLGLSIALGHRYARWLGWTAVVAGLGFLAGGAVTAQTGFSATAGTVLTPALLLLLVFVVGVCVSMWRHAATRLTPS